MLLPMDNLILSIGMHQILRGMNLYTVHHNSNMFVYLKSFFITVCVYYNREAYRAADLVNFSGVTKALSR